MIWFLYMPASLKSTTVTVDSVVGIVKFVSDYLIFEIACLLWWHHDHHAKLSTYLFGNREEPVRKCPINGLLCYFFAGFTLCHVKCHVLSWFFSNKCWLCLLPHLTPKENRIRQMRRRARTTFTAVVNRLKEKEPSSENLTIFWLDGKLMTSLSLI